jgi:hypothetical protein
MGEEEEDVVRGGEMAAENKPGDEFGSVPHIQRPMNILVV